MKRRVSPQEDKIRDYLYQRRNVYGENKKCSRKAIRVRKACVNRSFRRSVNNLVNVNSIDWDNTENKIASTKRPEWRKYADECLLTTFSRKWSDSSRIVRLSSDKALLQKEAYKRLTKLKNRFHCEWYLSDS